MNDRRGSQYYIKSDGGRLRGRNDSTKGKRKGKIPSGTEYTHGSAISKRKVPEIIRISDPELKLSMSNSNRNQSHSQGSDRHLHKPLQKVLHGVQRKRLGNTATNSPKSNELLEHPEKVAQIKKMKDLHKKKEGKKGRSPSSFYQQATSQTSSPRIE
ncbi:hypothetical protein O181_051319 [Austropuccinia psidii MF-1]|uniref:Uncharacterized protein n=1 Tax=Austropuccinia psidii MF-1 TaxID=1389203 RepID=A0A9Q3DYK9_9BASI|nr:hypothetical protein [Austropuccinia psidii MF-1]